MKGLLGVILCLALLGSGCLSSQELSAPVNVSAIMNASAQIAGQPNFSAMLNASAQLINQSNISVLPNSSAGSGEADCADILSPERTVVMGGAESVSVWLYGPQLRPGFVFSTPFLSFPVCSSGSAQGQDPDHLYCQPVPVVGYPRAEGTNGGGAACYIIEINELAPAGGLPSDFTVPRTLEAYPQLYQAWSIVNVTCRQC
jgi:hypothetical protein